MNQAIRPLVDGESTEYNEPIEIQIEKLIEKIKDNNLPDEYKVQAISQLKQKLEMSENFLQTPTFKAPLPKPIASKYPPKLEIKKAVPTVSIPDEAKSEYSQEEEPYNYNGNNHPPYYSQPPYYPQQQPNPQIVMLNQPNKDAPNHHSSNTPDNQYHQNDANLLSMLMPIKNLIYKTEIKNKKLKQQLENLVSQPLAQSKIQPTPIQPFKSLLTSTEAIKLAIDEPISNDLSPEEKMVAQMNAQEHDMIRLLTQLDKNGEMYQHKLNQYKQMSKNRVQMEKLIHKQRIDRLCKKDGIDDAEHLNRIKEEEKRKANLAQIEAQATNRAVKESVSMHKFESFRIYWDFLTGLPISVKNIDIAFSIELNNKYQEIFAISRTECENDKFNPSTNSCEILKISDLNEIIASPELRLAIEIRTMDDKGECELIGWSRMDIYNYMNQLINGLFVLYIFDNKDIEYSDETEFIRGLHIVPQARLYVRIAHVEGDYVNSFKPTLQSKNKYSIPQLLNVQYDMPEEDSAMPSNSQTQLQSINPMKSQRVNLQMGIIPENPNEESSPNIKLNTQEGIRGILCHAYNIKCLNAVKNHYVY